MNVYDFTTGKKGPLVSRIKLVTYMDGHILNESEIGLNSGRYEFQADAGRITGETIRQLMDRLQLEAVCFCSGYWRCGQDSIWQWHYTATPEWLKAHDLIGPNVHGTPAIGGI